MRVYVIGPLSKGAPFGNIAAAAEATRHLISLGYHAFSPVIHHLHAADSQSAQDYELWMRWSVDWLCVSEAVLRLPGASEGSDREVAEAQRLGIPVYTSIEHLRRKHPNPGRHREGLRG